MLFLIQGPTKQQNKAEYVCMKTIDQCIDFQSYFQMSRDKKILCTQRCYLQFTKSAVFLLSTTSRLTFSSRASPWVRCKGHSLDIRCWCTFKVRTKHNFLQKTPEQICFAKLCKKAETGVCCFNRGAMRAFSAFWELKKGTPSRLANLL